MPLDEQLHRITVTSVISVSSYIVMRALQIFSGLKFPSTGPNELMFFDSLLAVSVGCVSTFRTLNSHCGKMVCFVFIRMVFLLVIGICLYYDPTLFGSDAPAFDFAISWMLFSIYTTSSTACITICFVVFYTEEIFQRFSWNYCSESCCPTEVTQENDEHLPGYHDVVSLCSLPPTYAQAMASRPPGYTPLSTPTVTTPLSPVNTIISMTTSGGVRYNRYQADAEETMC